jgi:serine/threonine protein kinase
MQGKDIQSGDMMAIKVYNLNALGELNKVQLIREIRLHGSFVHRNIIELYVAFQVSIPCCCTSHSLPGTSLRPWFC